MSIKELQDKIWQYLVDQNNFKVNFKKIYLGESRADIESVLTNPIELKVPVTVAGNHTGLTGSAIPHSGRVRKNSGD